MTSVLIERDHLAVEDRVLRLENCGHVFQFRIASGEFILIPRDQPHLAVFDEKLWRDSHPT